MENVQVPLNVWSGCTLIALMFVLWALRNWGNSASWMHTPQWGALSSLLTGLITSAVQAITANGLNTSSLLTAIAAAFGAAVAQSKPTGTSVFLPFVLVTSMLFPGCGFCKVQANQNTTLCKVERVATQCAAPEVERIVVDILSQVTTALISSDWNALLGNIVNTLKNHGVNDPLLVVNCAVQESQQRSDLLSSALYSVAAPAEVLVLQTHAALWLHAHGVQ